MPEKSKRQVVGLGSGMIIDAVGQVVTDNHVVAGADKREQ